ncbi:MAG: ABC transporter substrate-binding protein [Burkholderiaceae bacterium]|nr:ABC transporter substrate-binding protein [Burkholderiaceae bacterium]
MNNRNSLVVLLTGLLATTFQAGASELEVPLVNYYNYVPFSMPDERSDLTRELAQLLTKNSGGRYRFVPQLLPKGRLDNMLRKENWQGLVVWLNPQFVNDEAKTRYLWSEPLMWESDLVVSHVEAPIDFNGIESLQGKVVGTILNQRYADIEGMIANKQLQRNDAPSQESNVRKLLFKRVDAVFVSRSTLYGLQQRIPEFKTKLHIAALPRNSFTRHIMLTPGLQPDLISYVKNTVEKLGGNPSWNQIAAQYHFEGQAKKSQ